MDELKTNPQLETIHTFLENIPENLEITDAQVDEILAQLRVLVASCDTLSQLTYITREVGDKFTSSKDRLTDTDLHESITTDEAGINAPLYVEDKYAPILKLWAEFPDTIMREVSKNMYAKIHATGIPVSMNALLDVLEDILLEYNMEGDSGSLSATRESIWSSILSTDGVLMNAELDDEQRDTMGQMQAHLGALPIILDNTSLAEKDFQRFRLLFDDAHFVEFNTKYRVELARMHKGQ